MALPVFKRTWAFDLNQQYSAEGTALATNRKVLRGIKDSLVDTLKHCDGMDKPWVVKRSSNGAGAPTNDDTWTEDADLVFSPETESHSWIVLAQPGIMDDFEICIDLSNSDSTKATIVWAPSGFPTTGSEAGDVSHRPRAAPEIVLLDNAEWLGGVTTGPIYIHAAQSVDGASTRVVGYHNHEAVLFWLFDQADNSVAGWDLPAVALATGGSTGNLTYDALHTITTPNLRGYGTAPMRFWMSTESFGDGPEALGAKLLSPNAFDSNWSLTPIGLAALDGRHGEIADLWFGSKGAHDGDTYPEDSSRVLVQFGHLVFPWDGTAEEDGTVPATA